MDLLQHLLSHKASTGKSIKKSTASSVTATWRTLHLAANGKAEMKDLEWLTNEKKVLKAIASRNVAKSTQKKMLSHVLVGLQTLQPIHPRIRTSNTYLHLQEMRDELEMADRARRETGELSERELANWISLDAIEAKIEQGREFFAPMLNGEPRDMEPGSPLEIWVFVALTAAYPSRLDMGTLRIVPAGHKLKEGTNYLVVGDTLTFHIGDWKNASRTLDEHGKVVPRIFGANATVTHMLRQYIRVSKKRQLDYLFTSSRDGSPLTRDAAGKRLANWATKQFEGTEHAGKVLNVTQLRKIILTYSHGESVADMEAAALHHGHSTETQQMYIKKLPASLKRKREE